MLKVNQSLGNNPFTPIPEEGKPVVIETDYHKDSDKFIIDYQEVEHVKITGDKDTDFIIDKEVREFSRTPRQEYIDSFRDDVGILNIIEKVRLSGDVTLLNQTGRVSIPGDEKDALGRNVENVADYTNYQVDKVDALEAYKKGIESARTLQKVEEFTGMSFAELAKLSDSELDGVLKSIQEKIAAQAAAGKENK